MTAGEFESLEFRNVSFSYDGSEKYALKNISFKITKNQTVALVGHNGAGKSTLVKLILRFYDTTQGEILYNGINIKEYTLSSLRSRFSAVYQDYKVFALDIFENILCKEITDKNEEEKVISAEKASGIYEKVCMLPDREKTVLTREFDEKGIGLSGGEQQKIAIARIFYKDCPYIILDEPSANLDPVAEYELNLAISRYCHDKTVIFISHRLSTTRHTDKIFMMENGNITESGTHDELMQLNGKYAEIFNLQAGKYN